MSPERRVEVTIRPALGAAEVEAAQELRVRVFSGEQGVSPEAELDGLDGEAEHVIALEGERVIGTCRLRFSNGICKLERMAIACELRGAGIGLRLLEGAEGEARRRGAERIVLHGQLTARGFYERGGYLASSEDVLVEEGIEHVRMERSL